MSQTVRWYPSRAWYAAAGLVVAATVVVTGALAYATVTELIERVDGFGRFPAPGTTTLEVSEPGRYGVYHEVVTPSSAPGGRAPTDFGLAVIGPDGAAVEVEPSDVTYGWGARRAVAAGEFEADRPGPYQVTAGSGHGSLAVGEAVPGGLLRGFEATLVPAGVVLAACLVLMRVVAVRRRHPPADVAGAPGPDGPAWPADASFGTSARSWDSPPGAAPPGPLGRRRGLVAAAAVAAVVAVAGGAAVAMAGGALDERADRVGLRATSGGEPGRAAPPPGEAPSCEGADGGPATCGPTFEELRETNLDYADRMPFAGDLPAATAVADEVRVALAPLAPTLPAPTAAEVEAALAPWAPNVTVSTDAVRTSGTAFGVSVDGGCVFGSVHDGTVDVEVGGGVNDGGCLASYGH